MVGTGTKRVSRRKSVGVSWSRQHTTRAIQPNNRPLATSGPRIRLCIKGEARSDPNTSGPEQAPWPNHVAPAHGRYYNQDSGKLTSLISGIIHLTRVNLAHAHYSPQYPPQLRPYEQQYAPRMMWSDGYRESDDARTRYSYSQYPPPESSARDERYPPNLPVPTSSLGQTTQQPAIDSRRERVPIPPSSPSQTFGPYSTVLQPSRDASVVVASGAELIHPHAHTLHEESGRVRAARTVEPSVPSIETSQFVVPSSHIPRAETAVPSRSSHSPEMPTETKPKRRRANAAQLRLLNETYVRTTFPTTEERVEIARRINMTPRQVQIW
jgi:hypothetical protein